MSSDSDGEDIELDKDSKWALYFLQRKRGYRYIEFVAKGSYGVVVTMYDDQRSSPVAVKCSADPGDVELECWPTFRHPNIVPLLETILLDCCAIFVMPLYRKDMWVVCDNGKFHKDPSSFGICRAWLKDILRGLNYLHQRSLCHLDLKLDNAFIKDNGHACLGDFSLMAKVEDVKLATLFLEHFQPPEFTPNYASLLGHDVENVLLRGDKADMWEFGIFIIDLLTNRKVSMEKNSKYEVWEYDVFPFLQKFVSDVEYMKYSLMKCFSNSSITDEEFMLCHDLLEMTLSVDPTNRISAKDALQHSFINVMWPMLQRPTGKSPVLLETDKRQGTLRMSAKPEDFLPPEDLRNVLEGFMAREDSFSIERRPKEETEKIETLDKSSFKTGLLAVPGPSGYQAKLEKTVEIKKKKKLHKPLGKDKHGKNPETHVPGAKVKK